jgi:hypothetical protein
MKTILEVTASVALGLLFVAAVIGLHYLTH